MRKWLYTLILAAATGAAIAPAAPVAASASALPSFELVSGIGTLGVFGDPTVRVNVFQFQTSALGQTVITYPDGTFIGGRATCLFVSGSTAYVTSRVFFSHGPHVQGLQAFPGSYIVIGIQADQPGSPGPDLMNFSPAFTTDPGCGPNGAAVPVFTVVRGDYHVFGPGFSPGFSPGL